MRADGTGCWRGLAAGSGAAAAAAAAPTCVHSRQARHGGLVASVSLAVHPSHVLGEAGGVQGPHGLRDRLLPAPRSCPGAPCGLQVPRRCEEPRAGQYGPRGQPEARQSKGVQGAEATDLVGRDREREVCAICDRGYGGCWAWEECGCTAARVLCEASAAPSSILHISSRNRPTWGLLEGFARPLLLEVGERREELRRARLRH